MPTRLIRPAVVALLAASLTGCVINGNGGGYNRPFGQSNNSGWNNSNQSGQTITCESEDGRNRSCRANMRIGRAEVDKQISSTPCQLGRTWGYDNNTIWVNQGCRARFRVYPGGGWGGNGGAGGDGSKVLRCESDNGKRRRCDAGFQVSRATVERQLSGTGCNKNQNWGNDGRGIWVDGGCRADFRVYRW